MINGSPGQTASVVIQTVNPNDNSKTGPTSTPTIIKFIDPNGDEDGDGMKNSAEDAAGTNPFDSSSLLKVMTMNQPDANHLALTWESVPGKKYQVQSAPSAGGTYNGVGPVLTAGSNQFTLSETVPSASLIFYRVALVP
jgi:hypothetical protein